jgi:hypothetical protein
MREPLGVFRAVVTRDGEGEARHGQPYYAITRIHERLTGAEQAVDLRQRGGELFEIQFGDGVWMLARAADLAAGSIGQG